MNLTADESVDFGIIESLRKAGIEVYSILEKKPGITDKEVLQIAYSRNGVLITEDKDFGELVYRLKLEHNGILLIRLSDVTRPERIKIVLETLQEYLDELESSFSVLAKNGLRIKSIK